MEKKVCELFAGVGGFRLGLEKANWKIIYSNQWEPKKKIQYASDCYIAHFGKEGHTNIDITEAKYSIPRHDLLVGGFPCQDYSVATTSAKGIKGKKGVLWWEIYYLLEKIRPPFILLENVDRLLRSPTNQKGRDFGVILACLNNLGYDVEWRVINAADYGFPQRRFRTFIFASVLENPFNTIYNNFSYKDEVIENFGFFAKAFPVIESKCKKMSLDGTDNTYVLSNDLLKITDDFFYGFSNAGFMTKGCIFTKKIIPLPESKSTLRDVLEKKVEDYFFISEEELEKWKYHKGAKAEVRVTRTGYSYSYKEGGIAFPDRLDRPSRTLITNEGTKKPNRFTHIIQDPNKNKMRILTPVETERLNGFPDNWTDTGMPLSWRYFCMGNSLVVGLIEKLGRQLANIISL